MSELLRTLQAYLDQQQAVILATVISGPADLIGGKLLVAEDAEPTGNLTDPVLRPAVQAQARRLLYHERSVAKDFGRARVFFDVYAPPPKLIVVGAVHIAIPLVVFAKEAGFQTVVVDPRTAFATPERFPQVDQLIHLWPDEALPQVGLTPNTYVVLLTHDPKLDDPALMVALPSKVAYVGALGSKKTHAKRVARLRQAGLTEDEIAGLHAPIGLDLGARTPAEIALSVIAEIVMIRRQAETRAAGDDN